MNELAADAARRALELEHKLAAYEKLHAEELDELRQLILQLTEDVLALGRTPRQKANLENSDEDGTNGAAVATSA